MRVKPRALYYRILHYQPENLALVRALFVTEEREDPLDVSDELLSRIEVMFAPLGFQLDAARMDRCPKLRVVVSNTTGIPHIDVSAAKERGIAICALHDEQEFLEAITPTAEHTIGLLLSVYRQIPGAHADVTRGNWNRRSWAAPKMLSRMRLGIVGYGRLGRKVASIASAMGMSFAYYDPYVKGSLSCLMDLAASSDVLSLHVPANAETMGLVSRKILEALPKGAIVINTARGEVLDLDALLDLLEAGHLAGAALDTLVGEYDPCFAKVLPRSRVILYARNHHNLILTPHIGGSTLDAWFETERFVIQKAARLLGLSTSP